MLREPSPGRGERRHGRGAAGGERGLGLGVAALLQIGVEQPVGVVAAAVRRPAVGEVVRRSGLDRRLVGGDGLVPHAERDEDVGGHVQGVRRVGGEGAVAAGGAQAERRVDGSS